MKNRGEGDFRVTRQGFKPDEKSRVEKSTDGGLSWKSIGQLDCEGKCDIYFEPITKRFLMLNTPYFMRGVYPQAYISLDQMHHWHRIKPYSK